jgi:hypothetical protein
MKRGEFLDILSNYQLSFVLSVPFDIFPFHAPSAYSCSTHRAETADFFWVTGK